MKLTLITKSLANGTYGELWHNGHRLMVTVEREWQNNAREISCVPAGLYRVKRHQSPKFGDCFALENPNLGVTVFGPSQRSHCLIHAANFPHQLQGCIAPGTKLHPSKWGVANSKQALQQLKQLVGKEDWLLEIIRH